MAPQPPWLAQALIYHGSQTDFLQWKENQQLLYPHIMWMMHQYASFGINDAQSIRDMYSRKQSSTEYRIVVIMAYTITHEAQNALLKLFEEPAPGISFMIVVFPETILLSTLVSRCKIMDHEITKSHTWNNTFYPVIDFISHTPQQRVDALQQLLKKYDQDNAEHEKMYVHHIRSFLNELVHVIHTHKKLSYAEQIKLSGIVSRMIVLMGYPSPSIKMILDFLACRLPVIS